MRIGAPADDDSVEFAIVARTLVPRRQGYLAGQPLSLEQRIRIADECRVGLESLDFHSASPQGDHFPPTPRCSEQHLPASREFVLHRVALPVPQPGFVVVVRPVPIVAIRSEERRVGRERRDRWATYDTIK